MVKHLAGTRKMVVGAHSVALQKKVLAIGGKDYSKEVSLEHSPTVTH